MSSPQSPSRSNLGNPSHKRKASVSLCPQQRQCPHHVESSQAASQAETRMIPASPQVPPSLHQVGSSTDGEDPGDAIAGNAIIDALPDDEGHVDSPRSSFVTTIASDVRRLTEENGRLYPSYGQHESGLPVDELEIDRLQVQHAMFYLLLNKRNFLSPIGNEPQNILDLATGTGDWAINMADAFPSAVVTGVDVAPIQPTWSPSNCVFEVCDIEKPWWFRSNLFDLIHMRDPIFVVRDWNKLVGKCFEHLKPGGWCELACTYLAPVSDNGSMPDSSRFQEVCKTLIQASKLFGATADCPLHFARYLSDAGFVNVTTETFKIPSCPWPDDEGQKEIGKLQEFNLSAGASAFGLRLFQRAFGWTPERTELEMAGFRTDSANRAYQQYCLHFVVFGQKPFQR